MRNPCCRIWLPILLVSTAATAQATNYTLSPQAIAALDVRIYQPVGLTIVKTPVPTGAEYTITFPDNSGFIARDWSLIEGGKQALVGLPLQNGDTLSLKYTLLSTTSPNGVVQVGPALNNSTNVYRVGSANLGGPYGNTVISTSPPTDQTSTTYVGSFVYLIDPNRVSWPANGGQVKILVTPAPDLTQLLPFFVSSDFISFAAKGAVVTGPQEMLVNAATAGQSWTVSTNQPWIGVSRTAGTGSGTFNISVNPTGITGQQNGQVIVTPSGAPGEARTVKVSLSILQNSTAPIGVIDTPASGSDVTGAVGLTGWALDDIEVSRVEIWRNAVVGETPQSANGLYVGQATFISGARPDVAAGYTTLPLRERAGWGLQVLTNMLPNSNGTGPIGNGTYTLRAVAVDREGNSTVLGSKVINVNNAGAVKPFGTLDTPTPGQVVSGTDFVVFGWALTPGTAKIPENGSTITVYIDGQPVGHPTYNQRRDDIVALFPGYTNTNGAVGFYHLNTTTLSNGLHTISWVVYDDQGRGEGIGSRYFVVQN